jgi:hypothetical protein
MPASASGTTASGSLTNFFTVWGMTLIVTLLGTRRW